MMLWIFETDTLEKMLADAEHVFCKSRDSEVAEQAQQVVRAIRAEQRARSVSA